MTSFDLRIKYRSDTGISPTHGVDADGIHTYRGGLTHEYAEWLENYNGNGIVPFSFNWKRIHYLKQTGNQATYYDNYRNIKYYKDYKLWLENLLCRVLTIDEKCQ